MHETSSAPVRENEGGGRSAGEHGAMEDGLPPPRRRASPLRLLAVALASIIVSGLLFRAAVEAVRLLTAP
jgi:hypothetical protein